MAAGAIAKWVATLAKNPKVKKIALKAIQKGMKKLSKAEKKALEIQKKSPKKVDKSELEIRRYVKSAKEDPHRGLSNQIEDAYQEGRISGDEYISFKKGRFGGEKVEELAAESPMFKTKLRLELEKRGIVPSAEAYAYGAPKGQGVGGTSTGMLPGPEHYAELEAARKASLERIVQKKPLQFPPQTQPLPGVLEREVPGEVFPASRETLQKMRTEAALKKQMSKSLSNEPLGPRLTKEQGDLVSFPTIQRGPVHQGVELGSLEKVKSFITPSREHRLLRSDALELAQRVAKAVKEGTMEHELAPLISQVKVLQKEKLALFMNKLERILGAEDTKFIINKFGI